MKLTILALVLCFVNLILLAQNTTLVVKAGEDVSKLISFKDRYVYGQFEEGQLYYPQSKRSAPLRLNYNVLYGVMQFIDPRGDTLYIPEDSNIFKYIRIGQDLYYHHFTDGYFNLLTREFNINLASQIKWKIDHKEMIINNGYGGSTTAVAGEFSSRRSGSNFVQNQNYHYEKEASHFLIGSHDKIYRANKGGFKKAFADYKGKIAGYIRRNDVNFNREDDLKELLAYCHTLKGIYGKSSENVAYSPSNN